MEIDRGYVSPYFVKNQELQSCEMDNPKVLITDRKISNMQDLVPLLEHLARHLDVREALPVLVPEDVPRGI